MKKSVKILTGSLGFIMLVPGLAKLKEPFHTFIYQHLDIIGFPYPEVMQYVVKFSEIGLGLFLIILPLVFTHIPEKYRKPLFYLGNLGLVVMMLVAIYTHLHPDVPAEILPLEYKPPVMGISYIILASVNILLFNKQISK